MEEMDTVERTAVADANRSNIGTSTGTNGSDSESSTSEKPPPGAPPAKKPGHLFNTEYHQNRAAREATFVGTTVTIGPVADAGILEGELLGLGSFATEAWDNGGCFLATRETVNGNPLHQNLCTSFDPSNLMCLTCPKKHKIDLEQPICICLSDQNFVPNLANAAESDNCILVVRLESAGLSELTDLLMEMVSQLAFRPGSVICLGSATFLYREGVSL